MAAAYPDEEEVPSEEYLACFKQVPSRTCNITALIVCIAFYLYNKFLFPFLNPMNLFVEQ